MAAKKIRSRSAARRDDAQKTRKKAQNAGASAGSGGASEASGTRAGRRGARPAVTVDRVAEIQRVIDVMVAAGAVEVELKDADTRLRVRLKEAPPVPVASYPAAPGAAMGATGPSGSEPDPRAASPVPGAAPAEDQSRVVFNSPMVGTFYRAASPDSDVFVDVGDWVSSESTICILEAMKVMNEIKAEVEGEVVEILAQNGEPVEFGQPLFVIKVA